MKTACLGLLLSLPAWTASPVPLHFEPNRGQRTDQVAYLAPVRNAVVLLNRQGIAIAHPASATTIEFEGGDPGSQWQPGVPAAGTTSYFKGADPARWLHDIPHFTRIERKNLYPGIDLVVYGAEG